MMKLKLTLIIMMLSGFCRAQTSITDYRHNLDRRINLNIQQQPVSEVLDKVSMAGGFYFSYSGKLFKQDSTVTISIQNKTVRDVLDLLFNGKVDYKEFGEYVILRYAANHLTIKSENITSAEQLYLISGYVIDTETGHPLKQASVYEKQLLQSTLTNNDGYFKLRFKGNHNEIILTASKESYRDTSLIFLSDIKIKPKGYQYDDERSNGFFNSIETSGISRFFISSSQRLQSLNIPDFFATTPFQASLIPGLSSHGTMSSQVINKVSLNVLGGYTAGVNGIEVGGLFNISKGQVKKMQAAGLFNAIGGTVDGVQIAGLMNDVGVNVNGVQAAGLLNHVRKNMNGVQIAGLTNVVSDDVKGIQIAGLFNYARKMHGMQIGVINISDYSDGYSIGLINYVHHGYHKVSLFTNETINTNVSYKMGNAKLYNILFAGNNFSDTAKLATAGFGFGHDFILNNRFSIAAEVSAQYIYLGNWEYANFMDRFQTNIQYQIMKNITLFGGPAYSVYTSDAPIGSSSKGYKQQVYPDKHHDFTPAIKGWMGWNIGIAIM